ncbi:hypothetical protein M0804_003164 [Polistes exclamans]|nr:hypothetical protein M0804_003164 [Polistes exclamans]
MYKRDIKVSTFLEILTVSEFSQKIVQRLSYDINGEKLLLKMKLTGMRNNVCEITREIPVNENTEESRKIVRKSIIRIYNIKEYKYKKRSLSKEKEVLAAVEDEEEEEEEKKIKETHKHIMSGPFLSSLGAST